MPPSGVSAITYEERKQIEKLLKDRTLSLSYVSRFLGRSKNAIAAEVRKNGGRDCYSADSAQKVREDAMLSRAEYLRNIWKRVGPRPKRRSAIDVLRQEMQEKFEMISDQIDILVNAIKRNK